MNSNRAALLLIITGLLGLIVLAVAERRALQEVVDITNQRKATRDAVVLAREIDVAVQALDRAHTDLLLDAAGRPAFDTADARLGDARDRLIASGQRLPEFAALIGNVTAAVANVRTLCAGDVLQGPAADLAAATARVAASAAQVRATQVTIERLVQALYDRIAAHEAAVLDRQRRASLIRWGSVLLLPALLGSAYLLLWRESRLRRDAEARLRDSYKALEAIVAERTAELQQSREDLRTLAASLDESIEAERRRLAREVHDQLGQTLTALKLHVHRRLAANPELQQCDVLLDDAIATTRRIAADLRPPLLDDLGLAAALSRLAEHTGLVASVRVEDEDALTPRQAEQLFRIAQEAVTNVLRHAKATHLWVEGGAAGGHYLLAVEDDGIGFNAAAVRKGALGLVGMRERARLADGDCRWVTPRRGGTRVEIRLPLAATQAA
jgi:protein-histidine pros-kinase